MWLLSMLVCMFGAVLGLTAAADKTLIGSVPLPPIGESDSTAGPAVLGDPSASNHKAGLNGGAYLLVIPVFLPLQNSPSWEAAANKVIADAIAGNPMPSGSVNNPTNYAKCNYRIDWFNLMYSTNINTWDGQTNPPVPFDKEYGRVPWALNIKISISGNDDVSLDSFGVGAKSIDSGNLLGDSVNFIGLSYSLRAPGIKADGSTITSGPTSQKARMVMVLVRTRLFNGGDTQTGREQVRNWVNSFTPYTLTYTAQDIGDDSTKSTASISTGTQSFVQPRLAIMGHAGHAMLSAVNAETNATYVLLSRQSVASGAWTPRGIVTPGTSLDIPLTSRMEFFTLKVQ